MPFEFRVKAYVRNTETDPGRIQPFDRPVLIASSFNLSLPQPYHSRRREPGTTPLTTVPPCFRPCPALQVVTPASHPHWQTQSSGLKCRKDCGYARVLFRTDSARAQGFSLSPRRRGLAGPATLLSKVMTSVATPAAQSHPHVPPIKSSNLLGKQLR